MKTLVFGTLCLVLLTGGLPAQPQDGDLIVGQFRDPTAASAAYGPGSIMSIDPITGKVFTIASSFTRTSSITMGPNWIEMASDNKNFMVASIPSGTTPASIGNGVWLHSVSTTGSILHTLVADYTPPATSGTYINAFDLDHDGTWILAGNYSFWSFNEDNFTYSTLWTARTPSGVHNAFVIDRALGGPTYVVGKFNLTSSTLPFIMGCDRSGLVTTVAAGFGGPSYISGIKIERTSGDYISSGFGTTAAGGGGEFMRTTKKGVLTTLNFPTTKTTLYRANAVYIDKQNLAYILTYDWQTQPIPTIVNNYVCSIYKMDLQGVFITQYIYSSTLLRGIFAPAGITEYGSRHVMCKGSGKPGTSVKIRFTSRKATDAGKAYQLGASFAYTNGFRMPNGEYLDLNLDSLFLLTVKNQAPMIFQNFTGFLDKNGEATAAVAIPSYFPPNLGLPIFVSGIVVDPNAPGGISTVGNTHWFLMD